MYKSENGDEYTVRSWVMLIGKSPAYCVCVYRARAPLHHTYTAFPFRFRFFSRTLLSCSIGRGRSNGRLRFLMRRLQQIVAAGILRRSGRQFFQPLTRNHLRHHFGRVCLVLRSGVLMANVAALTGRRLMMM